MVNWPIFYPLKIIFNNKICNLFYDYHIFLFSHLLSNLLENWADWKFHFRLKSLLTFFTKLCPRAKLHLRMTKLGFFSWLGLKLARCQSTANATIYWRTRHFLDFNEYSDMFKSSKKLFLDWRRFRILINAEEYICLKQFRINTVDPPLLNQQGSAHI